jgi:hypothetical protein
MRAARPPHQERVMIDRSDPPIPSSCPQRRTLLGGLLASLLAAIGPLRADWSGAAAQADRLAPPSERTQRCVVPTDGGSVDCSVRCPPGQVALSGGFSTAPGIVLSQFTRLGANGWLVTASASGDQGQSVVLVKVYCTA